VPSPFLYSSSPTPRECQRCDPCPCVFLPNSAHAIESLWLAPCREWFRRDTCVVFKRISKDFVCFYLVLAGFVMTWGYMGRYFALTISLLSAYAITSSLSPLSLASLDPLLDQLPNTTSAPSPRGPAIARADAAFLLLTWMHVPHLSSHRDYDTWEEKGAFWKRRLARFYPDYFIAVGFPSLELGHPPTIINGKHIVQLMSPPRPHSAPLCDEMMTASCHLVFPALQMVLGTCLKHQYFLGCHDMSVESMIWNILGLTLVPSWFYALGPGYANGPAWFMGTLFWLWCSPPP
jgi:hypothetical protein